MLGRVVVEGQQGVEVVADFCRCLGPLRSELGREPLRRNPPVGQVVPGYSAETKALRTVVHTRDDLVEMRVASTNQLAALLDAHWPGAKAIFVDMESPIALA